MRGRRRRNSGEEASMLVGKCRSCHTIYDVYVFKDCPKCGRYSGSGLNSVELLELAKAGPPAEADNGKTLRPSEGARLDVLRDEYKLVQDRIDGMDQRALTIKTWSVTTGMGGIAFALSKNEPDILLLSERKTGTFTIWAGNRLRFPKNPSMFRRGRPELKASMVRGQ
jgi:hypothetical protein